MPAPDNRQSPPLAVALIGFGEAARAFVSGWQGSVPLTLTAFDIKTDSAGPQRKEILAACERQGVTCAKSAPEAVAEVDVVFSFVTADQAEQAARSALPGLRPGDFYFDCNSCAPQTKQASAEQFDAAGVHYLDVAVMAPVHPRRHQTPVLASGPHVEHAVEMMDRLDMQAKALGVTVGDAAAVKLVRSIMIKGMEALTAECLLAGRTLGVEERVIDTLNESHPGMDWAATMQRNLERMMVHGRRRAAEMREACTMVERLGLPGRMAQAIANWQQQIGEQALQPGPEDMGERADLVLDALTRTSARRRSRA
ncbi:NAD(P)-dependent oxidoreductase [Aliiruegeria sabulilitoris]|uniref:NAD(P)-dependent oxidoreductase n=1 Tax=Aliiruegeria sabulilitoris TaxID=1510458 RepID=UPI0008377176|nr:DUF1932 domain-containing protein [Aliiruegeria sabulilitoris]NDR56924.1 NAD(P)-dependent oxidoreductase [Pseudoruegeria sp. M32A2M]